MSNLKLCMIGAGRHAAHNLYPCFRSLWDVEVVANADLDLERAQTLASRHGIARSYEDYHQMLEQEEPDGVLICVGPDFHAKAAMEVMQLGYHVFTEKPPALDLAQCKEVVEVHQKTGKICMTAFKKRFAPAGAKLKEIVASEDFGYPSTITVYRTRGPRGETLEDCLSYTLDSGIHMFDLVAWLFGPAVEVRALRNEPTSIVVQVLFANGSVGSMVFPTGLSNKRLWEEVTVTGSGGVIARMENSTELTAFKGEEPIAYYNPEWAFGSCSSAVEMGFVPELRAFVEAVKNGTTPESSIASVLPGMALLEATMASVKTGKTVAVERI